MKSSLLRVWLNQNIRPLHLSHLISKSKLKIVKSQLTNLSLLTQIPFQNNQSKKKNIMGNITIPLNIPFLNTNLWNFTQCHHINLIWCQCKIIHQWIIKFLRLLMAIQAKTYQWHMEQKGSLLGWINTRSMKIPLSKKGERKKQRRKFSRERNDQFH